ncbi:hypothetical protein EDB85DRAFT_1938671, partial [Lactarius pseudohatsudake]
MPPPLPHPLSAPPRSGGKAAHEGTPSSPPFPPCPCRVEGTRVGTPLPLLTVTPSSPCPLSAPPTSPSLPAPPFPFAQKEWAQGASLLHSRGRDAHEGTPPLCLRSHPFPLGHATHSHRRGVTRRPPAPLWPHRPIRAGRGHAATRHHPSPLAAPPRYAGRGHAREGTPLPAHHPSSFARKGGARGHAAPSPRRPNTSPFR